MIECYIIKRVVTSFIPIQLFKRWKFVVPNFDQLFGYYFRSTVWVLLLLFYYYFRVNLFYSSVIGLSRPKDVTFKKKPNNREVFFFTRTMYLQVYR